MGLLVQVVVLAAAALVANAWTSRRCDNDLFCEYPVGSRSYRCCDGVPGYPIPSAMNATVMNGELQEPENDDSTPATTAAPTEPPTTTTSGKDCEKVQLPQNGRVIVNGNKEGDTITFECDEGYELDGSADAVCLNTGKWSVEVPQCKQILCQCGAPDLSLIGDVRSGHSSILCKCGAPDLSLIGDVRSGHSSILYKFECPEDRRPHGTCENLNSITTPAPPARCYNNGDCPSGLLCCYDACHVQICKNPKSG